MLGIDSPGALFAKKATTDKEYKIQAERLTTEGDKIAKSYFSLPEKKSSLALHRLKDIVGDLGNLVSDAKTQGVAGTDELERNVNRWIAAKRYLID